MKRMEEEEVSKFDRICVCLTVIVCFLIVGATTVLALHVGNAPSVSVGEPRLVDAWMETPAEAAA